MLYTSQYNKSNVFTNLLETIIDDPIYQRLYEYTFVQGERVSPQE